jgi:hypothetical protein
VISPHGERNLRLGRADEQRLCRRSEADEVSTSVARFYYWSCAELLLQCAENKENGKQLAGGTTPLVPVNLLPRPASRGRYTALPLLLRQVFLAEIADST